MQGLIIRADPSLLPYLSVSLQREGLMKAENLKGFEDGMEKVDYVAFLPEVRMSGENRNGEPIIFIAAKHVTRVTDCVKSLIEE